MRSRKLIAFGSALIVLTVGAAPFLASAADHLDAPSLGSLSAGSLQGDRDINDVYVFQGSNARKTVIATTVSPAAGLLGPLTFGSNVRYSVKVDNTGDKLEDVAYTFRFGAPGSGPNGKQIVTVKRNGALVARGSTGNTVKVGDGKLWTGVRSDPFFFDLLGFRGTLGLGPNTNTLCDSTPTDFFASLNTLAIVLEVPDSKLGTNIGVWATTEQWINGAWVARDQMGRPAINTVFNSTAADKEQFNRTAPKDQATVDGGKFVNNTIGVLQALSGATDTEGAYTDAQAAALAGVLIPDVITYDTRTKAVGPLNGRALADDVIDVELNITTGGDPLGLFADRDATGGVPSDCVGPHTDYRATFPYLGTPH